MSRKRRRAIYVQPAKGREELEALYGRIWSVREVARDFQIQSIIGHSVVVLRKEDNAVGLMEYQEGPPQFYYNFTQQPNGQ